MNQPILLSTLTLLAALCAPVAARAQTQGQAPAKAGEPAKNGEKADYGSLITQGDNSTQSRADVLSTQVQAVGVDDTVLGDTVPVVPLIDETGGMTTLKGLSAGRPVLLELGYYRCPVICPLVLGNLGRYAAEIPELRPGRDYEVVSVSIDPKETAANAKEARDRALGGVKPELTAQGWHFLTASPASIKALTDACGFHYNYIPKVNQYAHPDVLVVLSPKGKVIQFLSGSGYDAGKLRSALAAAAAEKVVPTPANTFWGKCFSQLSLYGKTVKGIMMIGGVVTMVLVAAGFLLLRRLEVRRRASQT